MCITLRPASKGAASLVLIGVLALADGGVWASVQHRSGVLAPWAMRLRGGGQVVKKRSATSGNAWDELDRDDEELGGKRHMNPAQRQKMLKRERQRQKQKDAIDLDDDPRFNHKVESLNEQLGDADDISSGEIPNPNAPIDLASLPHLPWELPPEADAPGTRRADGSKTSWDRPRTGRDDDDNDDGEDGNDLGDEDEPYKKQVREEGETITGNTIADAETLERLAIKGMRWNASNEWLEPHTRIASLSESQPYWRALDKATQRADAHTVCKLLRNLEGLIHMHTYIY